MHGQVQKDSVNEIVICEYGEQLPVPLPFRYMKDAYELNSRIHQ